MDLLYSSDPNPIKGRHLTPDKAKFIKRIKNKAYKLSQKSFSTFLLHPFNVPASSYHARLDTKFI